MFFIFATIFLLGFITMPLWLWNILNLIDEYKDFNKKLKDDEPIKITFKQFREFHAIAPNKWMYKTEKSCVGNRQSIKWLTYNVPYHGYYIQFSFIDFIRFKRFVKQYEKNEKKKKDMSTKGEFIKYVQQDVNDYNDELIKMLKKEK